MKNLSLDRSDSILRDTVKAGKQFHLDSAEGIQDDAADSPKKLIPKSSEHKPLLCLIASQLLKSQH